jgi:hypothetical protein
MSVKLPTPTGTMSLPDGTEVEFHALPDAFELEQANKAMETKSRVQAMLTTIERAVIRPPDIILRLYAFPDPAGGGLAGKLYYQIIEFSLLKLHAVAVSRN